MHIFKRMLLLLVLSASFSASPHQGTFPGVEGEPGFDHPVHSHRAGFGLIDLSHDQQWIWATLGRDIGLNLLDSADLTGDGRLNVITTGGAQDFGQPQRIFVLHRDLENIVCVLEISESILDHYLFDADPDAVPEVLIATHERVFLMGGDTCAIEAETFFPSPAIAAGIGDVNGSGEPEIAFTIGDDLFVAPWDDFSAPQVRSGLTGTKIIVDALSRADGDDIGVLGDSLVVLRGDNLQTITEISGIPVNLVAFGDVTGDGVGEVMVTARFDSAISVFGLDGAKPILEIPAFNHRILKSQDVTGDGRHEIIYASRSHVYVFDGNGMLLHTLDSLLSSGVTNVLIVDLYESGLLDVIWGVGNESTGRNVLYRSSLDSQSIIWQSRDLRGPFQIAPIGEWGVAVTYNVSSLEPIGPQYIRGLMVLDRKHGNPVRTLPPDSGFVSHSAFAAAAADRLHDGSGFLLCYSLSWSAHGSGQLKCQNTESSEPSWDRQISIGAIPYMTVEDIDGNGQIDVLVVSRLGVVRLYDGITGWLKWQSPDLDVDPNAIDRGFSSVVNSQGSVIIAFSTGDIRKLDSATGDLILSDNDTGLTHIAKGGGLIYGIRSGEGVGVVDLETFGFQELIFKSAVELTLLQASPDGIMLMTASGTRPDLIPVLISSKGHFQPWSMGELRIWGERFSESGDLILATPYGAMSLSLITLHRIFSDRFD